MFHSMQRILSERQQLQPQKPMYQQKFSPIHKANELLSGEQHRVTIAEIKRLLNAPEAAYQELCVELMHNCAEFLQKLPAAKDGKFGYPGGWVDFALARANASLKLFQQYLHTGEAPGYIANEPELWTYAIFSAALLLDIGKLTTGYEIHLFDHEHNSLGLWEPCRGPMEKQKAHFYQSSFKIDNQPGLRQYATVLLARQLMPSIGFEWLASDSLAFHYWLATLNGEQVGGSASGSGGPSAIMPDAVSRVLQTLSPHAQQQQQTATSFFNKMLEQEHKEATARDAEKTADKDNEANATESETSEAKAETSPDQKIGAEFIEWLRLGIANEVFSVNGAESLVHMVREGALLSTRLFFDFAAQRGVNPQSVFNAFNQINLGNAQASAIRGLQIQQFAALTGPLANLTLEGIIMTNPQRLYSTQTPVLSQNVKLTSSIIARVPNNPDIVRQRVQQNRWPGAAKATPPPSYNPSSTPGSGGGR